MPVPTAIEAFLAPLVELARKMPEIEALVFWGDEGIWPADPAEALESEEIAFYAEGLLLEGFHLVWQILATPDKEYLDSNTYIDCDDKRIKNLTVAVVKKETTKDELNAILKGASQEDGPVRRVNISHPSYRGQQVFEAHADVEPVEDAL